MAAHNDVAHHLGLHLDHIESWHPYQDFLSPALHPVRFQVFLTMPKGARDLELGGLDSVFSLFLAIAYCHESQRGFTGGSGQ